MKKRKIIVVGCGRSGTLYMSKVFEILGLDVGHEKLGKDGISSWYHSFGNRQKKLIQAQMKNDERIVIHLLRDPIDVVNSMVLVSKDTSRRGLAYFRDLCPEIAKDYEDFELAMAYWIHWNKMIEQRSCKVNLRINVANVSNPAGLFSICMTCGINMEDLANDVVSKINKLGNKTHQVPQDRIRLILQSNPELRAKKTFGDLLMINKKLAREMFDLAYKYGLIGTMYENF